MKVNRRFMACLQAYSYLDWFQWTYSQNFCISDFKNWRKVVICYHGRYSTKPLEVTVDLTSYRCLDLTLSDYLEKFFDDVESKCVDEYHLNIL